MGQRLEHANITVASVEKVRRFLQTAFPEFRIRGESRSETDGVKKHWQHVGTDDTYIALEELTPVPEHGHIRNRERGVNHLGFVVDDLDGVVDRLREGGYDPGGIMDEGEGPWRRRVYILDGTGNEWEFVEYLTDDMEKAHAY